MNQSGRGAHWKVVALTCGPSTSCDALHRELIARQSKGLIPKDTLLLVIDDPVKGIGSGGATLNALLVITENLASQAGYTVVNSDVLDSAHILILHVGRQYMYNSTGRAFVHIPSQSRDSSGICDVGLMTTLDHLIHTMSTQIAIDAPPGVWVCSTDMVLSIPQSFKIDWSCHTQDADVIALSVHGDVEMAHEHGVYVADAKGIVSDILYRASTEQLESHTNTDGKVNVVIGVVYFNKKATEKLLSFHTVSPLNRCTYVGIDSGAQPIQVSLFFDLLYAMCGGRTPGSDHHRSAVTVKMPAEQYRIKWRLLHKILSDLRVKTVTVEEGQFHYLFNDRVSLQDALQSLAGGAEQTLITVNSVICDKIKKNLASAYISDSRLTEYCYISDNVIVSGVDCSLYQSGELTLHKDMVYQHVRVQLSEEQAPATVPVIFGATDSFKTTFKEGTFCNESWEKFLSRTGCLVTDLWPPNLEEEERKLGNARLFPVMYLGDSGYRDSLCWMQPSSDCKPSIIRRWKNAWRLSLEEILEYVDFCAQFSWNREIFAELAQVKVKDTLLQQKTYSLISLYKNISTEQPEHCQRILEVLDQVAGETDSPGIAARALANIADVLGCMAGSHGGLRSGPSANTAWKHAYELLEAGKVAEGVTQLANIRCRWLSTADHIVRAARHYEGAAQILIRRAVMSARAYITLTPSKQLPDINRWIIGESPARADIAGGWSDTPPISYEHGGAVTNAAILVDGKKPIGCKARRIAAPQIELVMNSGTDATKLVIKDIDGLRDYFQPQSPGALLKAAFVCSNIIHLDCGFSLAHHLTTHYGSGFELHTWSNLPHGSGLGTSSILAGVVLAVLWKTSGENYTMSSLVHAVLHLEQMMTTGGGWQDQVGGLIPGIKIGMSEAKLPLFVDYRLIELPEKTLKEFNDRFLLVYTGKTRLARNLLQNVVRNWYARDPAIVKTEDDLVRIAYECEEAFKQYDLVQVGELWTTYWQLKKQMATGCEPASVSQMIHVLKPHVLSCCMAGAGGGGFLYVLTKEPNQRLLVEQLLAKLELAEAYSVHDASVCTEGLTISESEA